MMKYIGSKRTLVPVLRAIAVAVEARTALDLFTGTTRVAQGFKSAGIMVTAADLATYAHVLAHCFIETDASAIDADALHDALAELEALPGRRGYVTETFCERARFFQPSNGMRIDAMRDHIEARHAGTPLHPILLTALLLAADRVDSTTGVQMAYLKEWAPRSYRPIALRMPVLLPGTGQALRGDASALVDALPHHDLAYLDPPYNRHRYFSNYHVWETLVRWDAPAHFGKACKRVDARTVRSAFNAQRAMPGALRSLVHRVRADVVVVSHNNESWVSAAEIADWLREAGHESVAILDFDAKRYVGAQIGIYSPSGAKVGCVSHLRNVEHVLIAGPRKRVARAVDAARSAGPAAPSSVAQIAACTGSHAK